MTRHPILGCLGSLAVVLAVVAICTVGLIALGEFIVTCLLWVLGG